jgi:hypothetical protein
MSEREGAVKRRNTLQIKHNALLRDGRPIQKEFQNPIFGKLKQLPFHRLGGILLRPNDHCEVFTKKINLALDNSYKSLILKGRRLHHSKVGTNEHSATRILANAARGSLRPLAVRSLLNLLLIILVNLLVLGLIIIA